MNSRSSRRFRRFMAIRAPALLSVGFRTISARRTLSTSGPFVPTTARYSPQDGQRWRLVRQALGYWRAFNGAARMTRAEFRRIMPAGLAHRIHAKAWSCKHLPKFILA
jgi:hypothetical protein